MDNKSSIFNPNLKTFNHKNYNHVNLVKCKTRNKWYNKQITLVCQNKICLDIGSGSGILSLMAIEGKAKHIYMIERISLYCAMASQLFKTLKIPKSKYTIINQEFDSNIIEQIPQIDVIFSDTISGHFFHQDYHHICQIISQSKSKNAIFIPNILTGEFAIFDDHESVHQKVITGIKAIDEKYDINTQLIFKTDVDSNQRQGVIKIFNKELNSESDQIRKALKQTFRMIIKDVIKFDTKNPDINLCWTKNIKELENKKYGMAFYGSISAGYSKKLFMPLDCWNTHFYVFNKTTDIMQVKFNESIGDFVINSI